MSESENLPESKGKKLESLLMCYFITKQSKNGAGQYRTGQYRTGQDRTGQDRTGKDRTEQDRTRQNKTEQDRTRQNRTMNVVLTIKNLI